MNLQPLSEAVPSCPKVRRRVVGSNVWLLSFGDLVTLLLGFFVAIIAYAMQHPPQNQPVTAREHGTTLATTKSEELGGDLYRTVTVAESFFDNGGGQLTERGAKFLKVGLNSDDIQIRQARISSCLGETSEGFEARRFVLLGRVLAIAGQLIDSGAPAESVKIQAPGSACENGLTPGSVEIAVTGRRKVSNG